MSPKTATILIVDDEAEVLASLDELLLDHEDFLPSGGLATREKDATQALKV